MDGAFMKVLAGIFIGIPAIVVVIVLASLLKTSASKKVRCI
jgi:hypothetical protein